MPKPNRKTEALPGVSADISWLQNSIAAAALSDRNSHAAALHLTIVQRLNSFLPNKRAAYDQAVVRCEEAARAVGVYRALKPADDKAGVTRYSPEGVLVQAKEALAFARRELLEEYDTIAQLTTQLAAKVGQRVIPGQVELDVPDIAGEMAAAAAEVGPVQRSFQGIERAPGKPPPPVPAQADTAGNVKAAAASRFIQEHGLPTRALRSLMASPEAAWPSMVTSPK